MMSKRQRPTADDIRRNWHAQSERVFAAQHRRDAYERARAGEWEIIEASRCNLPGRKLDTDTYIKHKIALGNLESKIEKLDCLISMRRMVRDAMPSPTKSRPRKTVLIDGIRTKIEREYA
jgi:hypothetical protein